MSIISIILLIFTISGACYYIFSTCALVSHFKKHTHPIDPSYKPRVTLLKPIRGLDPDLHTNLTSYLKQDYPNYEVLFGVLDENDPSIPEIEKAIQGVAGTSLHIGSSIEGSNNKVKILHNLSQHSTGKIIIVTDADTRVTPDFLNRIAAPFKNENIGAVTCLYKGINAKSIPDALEGLHMTCIFAPGVACAEMLNGIDFGLGAAIAIRKSTLEQIGGFAPIANYLADDFQLGRRTAEAGYKVYLSDYVMSDVLQNASIKDVLARELRWSITTRISRPKGHFGLIFTYGFVYALGFLLSTNFSTIGWSILGIVTAIRITTAYIGARSLNDNEFPKRIYLLPIRDILSFTIWLIQYFYKTVTWRGRKLKLKKDGTMQQIK